MKQRDGRFHIYSGPLRRYQAGLCNDKSGSKVETQRGFALAKPRCNRAREPVSGVTTVYVAGIYEYQADATTKYYEGGGLRRAGYSTNNGVFYMLSDHLKSTSALVARNGVLNVKYFYYPYGARRGVPFNTITAKDFTGQYHETALPGGEGLSYYGARWYDPKLGRFLSADTIVPNPSNPQDLNRFAYVRNNPLRFVGPSGHYLFEDNLSEPYRPPKPVKSVPPTKLWTTTGYGTLDSSHWNAGNPAQVIKDTRTAILAGGGQVTVRGGVIGAEHSTSYLVSGDASIYDAKSIALGIYMDWSYKFEEWEGHVWG
ncbi:MAG: RHS repeat-associated core domain-containing protein [Anaerolineae bacterium]|nr:RHS repeat-associated core domain-containing protein [Anaerolineae bacterium]